MSTKLTHHIFLRLAGPNKGPECCLGGAGHLLVPLSGVRVRVQSVSFLQCKLLDHDVLSKYTKFYLSLSKFI